MIGVILEKVQGVKNAKIGIWTGFLISNLALQVRVTDRGVSA
jgi:hypothetical protein